MKAALQIGLLTAIFVGCDFAARALRLPLPGNVVGMIVLAALLRFGVVPLKWVEGGADLLLRHLGLLFVPAAVLVLRVWGVLRGSVLAVSLVVIVSTLLVMITTGLVAQRLGREP